ncbi:MAG: nitroreductase/quinone reductase family protein [Streptosporangiaceae bacterium]
MRSRKYRVVTAMDRASNRLIRFALRAGFAPRAFALLETTGRRTGRARHTPVGNGLAGNTFWLVAAHGTQADYVRNLQAEPRVRVKADGVWRAGTAVVLPGDDPAARSRTLPYRWDAAIGRVMASAPLTIRIDLVPDPGPETLAPEP